ncbi:MAG: hypothetical protein FJW20_22905 [Acidimicrobiia bacterium]|nr:hypothetical protein [Acidimicrobiia bacterium]
MYDDIDMRFEAVPYSSLIELKGSGRFAFFDLGGPTEECVEVLAEDQGNQEIRSRRDEGSFRLAGIRPRIRPTPILMEGNGLASISRLWHHLIRVRI